MEYSFLSINKLASTREIIEIAKKLETDYIFLHTRDVDMGYKACERFIDIAKSTNAGLLYSDFYITSTEFLEDCQENPYKDRIHPNPLGDYLLGSIRDDFDFGHLILVPTIVLINSVERIIEEQNIDLSKEIVGNYKYAGFYDLKLRLSEHGEVVHINEYLYSTSASDDRKSGEKQFDYVNPRNREVQIEMEEVFTEYLKRINAFLPPVTREINFSTDSNFKIEASVIIPVRNRKNTIRDAVVSALSQVADFKFNVIVIDNHSSDGTSEILKEIGEENKNLVHIIPDRNDLGIGGCWNLGVHSDFCGKFAVQLDSDDVYSSNDVLQRIVSEFYIQKCAMMVGTYMLTNFNLEEISPGIIDHREWTEANGHNNALRINGLGAPRAFYTPVLRTLNLPNTSYGEDYAIGLRISREYKIGRIYDVLYYCRRWEGNSDASLDVVALNKNNLYKDRIRTWEIQARKMLVAKRINSDSCMKCCDDKGC